MFFDIHPPWSNQRGIKPLRMISSHENDPFLRSYHAIESIQKAGERYRRLKTLYQLMNLKQESVPLFTRGTTTREGGIYIFQHHYTSFWNDAEDQVETIIGEPPLGQVENTDIVIELTS